MSKRTPEEEHDFQLGRLSIAVKYFTEEMKFFGGRLAEMSREQLKLLDITYQELVEISQKEYASFIATLKTKGRRV